MSLLLELMMTAEYTDIFSGSSCTFW